MKNHPKFGGHLLAFQMFFMFQIFPQSFPLPELPWQRRTQAAAAAPQKLTDPKQKATALVKALQSGCCRELRGFAGGQKAW